MSTNQEYWDACLIRTWRNFGKVSDAMNMYKSIAGKYPDESILRQPRTGFPWTLSARVFVANHLEKINERLSSQAPEKDIALLHKLRDSKYDTTKDSTQVRDKDLNVARNSISANHKRMAMNSLSYENRNQATDWRVTK
jgi:hypothetical protein